MTAPEVRKLRLWQNRITTDVEISGSGPPLLYLHGPWGLNPDRPFVEHLASTHTVYAPKFPGTTSGDHEAIHALDQWLDLVVYHGELIDALKLAGPALAGHSFGGLVAAEIAAASPGSVGRLALIDPVGLWRDDLPVKNWMLLSDDARRRALFADPAGEAAQRFFAVPGDPAQRVETLAAFVWAQACTGKFVWPIADRGFKNRIHRISAPTLIVWGAADGVIDPAYANEFARFIADAQVELIERAGHLPHLENLPSVGTKVGDFLAGQDDSLPMRTTQRLSR